MRRARRSEILGLLRRLRSGNANVAGEAMCGFYKFDDAPLKPVLTILEKSRRTINREYAAYCLITLLLSAESRIFKKRNRGFNHNKSGNEIYRKKIAGIQKAVIKTIENDESAKVRAQALETIGMSVSAGRKRCRLRSRIERCVIGALSDSSPEVRFWACYAAGELKMKSALGKLSEMAENDISYVEFWWRVSEEAADAIEWTHGRFTEARVPGGQFETTTKESIKMAEQGKNKETTQDDVYNDSEKDTTATGRNLPNGDGTVSDEDVQAITGENDDRPTGQDHSTDDHEKQEPTDGVGAVQSQNDATSDVAHIEE